MQRLSSFELVAADGEIDALAIKALDLHLNCFRHQPRITLGQMAALLHYTKSAERFWNVDFFEHLLKNEQKIDALVI